jgi:S1/P1 Nuclease
LVILLGLLAARDVYAWDDIGHPIIWEIAFHECNPPARARVIRLLDRDPNFSLLSKACTWSDHRRKRASEHFVNLPRSNAQIGDDSYSLDATCVVTAIDAEVAVLS